MGLLLIFSILEEVSGFLKRYLSKQSQSACSQCPNKMSSAVAWNVRNRVLVVGKVPDAGWQRQNSCHGSRFVFQTPYTSGHWLTAEQPASILPNELLNLWNQYSHAVPIKWGRWRWGGRCTDGVVEGVKRKEGWWEECSFIPLEFQFGYAHVSSSSSWRLHQSSITRRREYVRH